MDGKVYSSSEQTLLKVLPHRRRYLQRLAVLADANANAVVTVLGKYNHGKSRLLNALLGQEHFSVADKRETVALQAVQQQGLTWLDAPGLDADIATQDDDLAQEATWVQADVRLVVHAVKEGELDASEIQLLEELAHDASITQRQHVLVLTQIDQLSDEATLRLVLASLQQQLPHTPLFPVSSARYQKGVEQAKPLFVEKSQIPALQKQVLQAVAQVPAARVHERAYYLQTLRAELLTLGQQYTQDRASLTQSMQDEERAFTDDLQSVLAQIAIELHDIMQDPPVDHALETDTIHDVFTLTASKLERSRLQIAYSKACIQIRAVLTQYGVLSLPLSQQVGAASLSTVMVAVMGVSVKYRADLRRLFADPAGRQGLVEDFTVYFLRSDARTASLQRLAVLQTQLEAVQQAEQELTTWEA